jgi:hypothetical protein
MIVTAGVILQRMYDVIEASQKMSFLYLKAINRLLGIARIMSEPIGKQLQQVQ